MVQNCHSELDR